MRNSFWQQGSFYDDLSVILEGLKLYSVDFVEDIDFTYVIEYVVAKSRQEALHIIMKESDVPLVWDFSGPEKLSVKEVNFEKDKIPEWAKDYNVWFPKYVELELNLEIIFSFFKDLSLLNKEIETNQLKLEI